MMEFTCNGAVRWGFGFYNPNHAAALFCVLVPFAAAAFFYWRHWALKLLAALLFVLLTLALGMTFSRTGALVLILELTAYFLWTKKNGRMYWICAGGTLLSAGLILLACGLAERTVLDGAVTNRPLIWLAGIRLSASNPCGVGLGNSGLLATAFLLPDGISCRTLVNSHLTLLAEFGVFVGFAWFTLIFYAFWNGIRKPLILIVFAGLTLCAASASIFDWPLLFDFHTYGGLSFLNFFLSWLLFLLYLGFAAYLCIGGFQWKKLLIPLIASLFFCSGIFCFYSDASPKIRNGLICRSGETMPLVLYDDAWNLKQVLSFLPDGYFLPLRSWQSESFPPDVPVKIVYLFGECIHFSGMFPEQKLVLIAPPDSSVLPANVIQIHLKRYGNEAQKQDAEAKKIPLRLF